MFYNQLYNQSYNLPKNNSVVNNYINNVTNNISNKTQRIHINTNPYIIQSNDIQFSEITYVAEIPTTILLPIINQYNEDSIINIINNSSSIVTLKTQNQELLFNSFHLPPDGTTETNLKPNKFCKLIIKKKNKIYSFILLTT